MCVCGGVVEILPILILMMTSYGNRFEINQYSRKWDCYLFLSVMSLGSTIITLLHEKISPKNRQVLSLSLGDAGFLQLFRAVSRDSGPSRKPPPRTRISHGMGCFFVRSCWRRCAWFMVSLWEPGVVNIPSLKQQQKL